MFESNLRSLAGYFRAVGDDVEVHEFEAGRRVVNTGPVEFPTLFLNVLQFLDRLVQSGQLLLPQAQRPIGICVVRWGKPQQHHRSV